MENLSKLSAEDLKKLQKGIIEELSRRDNEAWGAAADIFKKAYEELIRVGLGAPQVMIDVTSIDEDWNTVEYTEVTHISIDKTNRSITIEVEDIEV